MIKSFLENHIRLILWMSPFLVVLGIASVLHLLFWGLIFFKRPMYEGKIKIPIEYGEAKVIRDANGIPHITGSTQKSAFFALGYTIAQDRLFQMDLQRRVARGELSEIFGEALLPTDKFLRTLGLVEEAENYLRKIPKIAPEAWVEWEAFLEGVNACRNQCPLPIEFTLLGYEPRPFQKVDSLAFLYFMGFSFQEGIKSDSLYSLFEKEIVGRVVSELFPRYDREDGLSNPSLASQKNDIGFPLLPSLAKIVWPVPTFDGSNGWILASNRTKEGRAMLANDPHIGFSNPGTWFEAELTYPGYTNYGLFLPSWPHPVIGHNQTKAWGLTMLEQDDINLYAEKVEGEKVLWKGSWVPMVQKDTCIPLKGKPCVPFKIQLTPHGPLFQDFLLGEDQNPVSLYWVQHHAENPLPEVLYLLGRASSPQDIENGGAFLTAPGLNLLYADAKGHIAWFALGKFPILPQGVSPRKVLDGSNGKEEVLGFLPYSQNPKTIDPKEGVIVSANQAPKDRFRNGIGYLEGNWQPIDRYLFLEKKLNSQLIWSREEIQELQNSSESQFAPELLARALPALRGINDPLAKEALYRLQNWNYQNKRNSVGATIYQVFFSELLRELYLDELGEEKFNAYLEIADSWMSLRYMIRNSNSLFWDDQNTVGYRETQDEIFQRAFLSALEYLKKNLSASPNLWQWERLFAIKHPHPLGAIPILGGIFEFYPDPVDGAPEVVTNFKTRLGNRQYLSQTGPSSRRVLYPGFRNFIQIPLGNSGNLGSEFYGNLRQDYLQGKYRELDPAVVSGKLLVFEP